MEYICVVARLMEYLFAAALAVITIIAIVVVFETSAERKLQRKYLKDVKRNGRP